MWEAKLADYHAQKWSSSTVQYSKRQNKINRNNENHEYDWYIYSVFFHLFDYVLVYVSIFIAEYQDLAICFISFHFICHETLCNVSHLHRFRYNVICVCVFFFLCFRQRWKEIRVCLHYKYTQQMCWLRPNTPNVINDGSVDRHQWVVIYGSTCMRERHNVPSLRCIQNCHSHSVRVIWCKNGAKRMWRENVSTHADGTPENAISNFHWALDAVALHI